MRWADKMALPQAPGRESRADAIGASALARRRSRVADRSGSPRRGVRAQPGGELVGAAAVGGLGARQTVVPGPGRVRTGLQVRLGGVAPAAVRGAPQGVVELLPGGRRLRELVAEAVDEAQAGGLPQGGARAAFEQSPRG